MKPLGIGASALGLCLALGPCVVVAQTPVLDTPPKKLLVELHASPGSRPDRHASDLVGSLAQLGYGPDRAIALTFRDGAEPGLRMDADPLAASRRRDREARLGKIGQRATLRLIIDGRASLVEPDRATVLAALASAGREPVAISLALELSGSGTQKMPSVRLAARTLVEHQVVRRFAARAIRLEGERTRTLTIPVAIPEGQHAGHFRVAAFVEDCLDGSVHQAESIPWAPVEVSTKLAGRKLKPRPRSGPSFSFALPGPGILPPVQLSSDDDPSSCPDCGTPLSPEYLASLPPGFSFPYRFHFPNIPSPRC